MDVKVKFLCEALVTCLDELPDNMHQLENLTSLVQQTIAQILHKLSLGRVTKVYFDSVAENTIEIRVEADPDHVKEVQDDTQYTNYDTDGENSETTSEQKSQEPNPERDVETHEELVTAVVTEIGDTTTVLHEEPDLIDLEIAAIKKDKHKWDSLMGSKISVNKRRKKRDNKEMKVAEIKRYGCCHCDSTFFDNAKLKRHLLSHTGERPFECSTCGQRFRQKAHLKDHIKRHSGVKDYVCDTCGKSFSFSRNLTRHVRIHTGERPFPCDMCSEAFITSDKLFFHKLKHSGLKPYCCPHCRKSFRRPDYLKVHKCKLSKTALHSMQTSQAIPTDTFAAGDHEHASVKTEAIVTDTQESNSELVFIVDKQKQIETDHFNFKPGSTMLWKKKTPKQESLNEEQETTLETDHNSENHIRIMTVQETIETGDTVQSKTFSSDSTEKIEIIVVPEIKSSS